MKPICAVGAALEGLAAGTGVRQRFSELRMPPCSPPLPLWIAVGVTYYVVCFIVAYRLLSLSADQGRAAPLVLLLALMAANAAWNYVFSRRKSLAGGSTTFVPYALLALTLLLLLIRLDPVAFWAFLPYVIYLPYAAWWLYALRQANGPEQRADA